MFKSRCSQNFLRKFRSLIGLCLDRPLRCDNKITPFHILPSSEKHKHHTPVRRNDPKKKLMKLSRSANVGPKLYMRDTISRISNLLRYSSWDSAQEQLEKVAIKWDSYTVNQVLKTHPPMEKTWLFFNWVSTRKGFKHDQYTYTTMLDIFGEAKRIESMKYLFHQMQERGVKVDAVTYTSMLHWLSNDGDIDGAINLWKEMRDKECYPTVVSYTAYMKILFDHDRVKEATGVYKDMLQAGCSPNCYTYTVLMEHLANTGRCKDVMEIFNKMQEVGVPPDKAACNILVSKFCKAVEIKSLLEVLEYMRDKALVLRISVYRQAIETLETTVEGDALLRHIHRHLAMENFDKDIHTKVVSDDSSVLDGAVILHLLSKQNIWVIDSLLVELRKKNIKVDSGIISMVVEVQTHKHREVGALTALEYSSELGISVDRSAYLTLLGFFLRTNRPAMVVNVVEKISQADLSLGSQQSALLVYRLGYARELVSAVKVFSLLRNKEKNTATYTALIAAFLSSGNSDKALETFEGMRTRGINASLGTYCVMLAGLEKTGQIHKLEGYRKEKKNLQARSCAANVSTEEKICNLMFAGDFVI